jgi:hypothetical protein
MRQFIPPNFLLHRLVVLQIFLPVFLFCDCAIRPTDFVYLKSGRYDHTISHRRHVSIVDL